MIKLDRERVLNWADVLVLGPYLVYSSRGLKNKYFRTGMAAVGVGTMLLGLYELARPKLELTADPELPAPTVSGLGARVLPRRQSLGALGCGCHAAKGVMYGRR